MIDGWSESGWMDILQMFLDACVCILNVQVYLWVDDWKDRWVDMDGWISRQVGRWLDRLSKHRCADH